MQFTNVRLQFSCYGCSSLVRCACHGSLLAQAYRYRRHFASLSPKRAHFYNRKGLHQSRRGTGFFLLQQALDFLVIILFLPFSLSITSSLSKFTNPAISLQVYCSHFIFPSVCSASLLSRLSLLVIPVSWEKRGTGLISSTSCDQSKFRVKEAFR